jgi:hypothetical protein
MALRIKKMAELEEVNTFLRGGHIGGKSLKGGLYGLDGKTLVFTTPVGTVTFATPNNSQQESLSLRDIMDQINAVHTGMAHTGQGGKLFLEMPTPAGIVATSASSALALLGFDKAGLSGTVYNPPAGATPALRQLAATPLGAGSFILLLDE